MCKDRRNFAGNCWLFLFCGQIEMEKTYCSLRRATGHVGKGMIDTIVLIASAMCLKVEAAEVMDRDISGRVGVVESFETSDIHVEDFIIWRKPGDVPAVMQRSKRMKTVIVRGRGLVSKKFIYFNQTGLTWKQSCLRL
jgi:hypothetical protein